MAAPTISDLPDAPQQGESFSTFTSKANAHVAALEEWTSEANAIGSYVESKSAVVESATSEASAAKDGALASADFKGDWSNLTGSISVPASVRHDGVYWMLINDLADVTASEPTAASPNWDILLGTLFDEVTDFTLTYDASNRADTFTETLSFSTRTTEYAYNSDSTVNTAIITIAGKQRTETFSYTDGRITGMSSTEGNA